jgi:myo-inositol-1(or 4)-monophosphatase
MHPMLNAAVKAARRAGRLITRASVDVDTLKVARKQQNDFVTEVDRAAEDTIIDTLRSAYPHHTFLAEESGLTVAPTPAPLKPVRDGKAGKAGKDALAAMLPETALVAEIKALSDIGASADRSAEQIRDQVMAAEFVWIIDPLDGTTNFIHGFPQYCISIALMERGLLTQAVVYDPNRDELYTASKGRGAFLNDRRIRVSKRAKIDEAVVGTGFPYREMAQLDRYLEMFKVMTQRTAAVRRPGAAALDLAYVAAGRYDGFFEIGLAPWDVAAGALLITEAGGLIGDLAGDPNHLFGKEVLAGNPKVFAAMMPLLTPRPRAAPAPFAPLERAKRPTLKRLIMPK